MTGTIVTTVRRSGRLSVKRRLDYRKLSNGDSAREAARQRPRLGGLAMPKLGGDPSPSSRRAPSPEPAPAGPRLNASGRTASMEEELKRLQEMVFGPPPMGNTDVVSPFYAMAQQPAEAQLLSADFTPDQELPPAPPPSPMTSAMSATPPPPPPPVAERSVSVGGLRGDEAGPSRGGLAGAPAAGAGASPVVFVKIEPEEMGPPPGPVPSPGAGLGAGGEGESDGGPSQGPAEGRAAAPGAPEGMAAGVIAAHHAMLHARGQVETLVYAALLPYFGPGPADALAMITSLRPAAGSWPRSLVELLPVNAPVAFDSYRASGIVMEVIMRVLYDVNVAKALQAAIPAAVLAANG